MKKQLLITTFLLVIAGSTFAQNTNRIEAANKSVTGMTSSGGSKGYGVTYQYTPSNNKDSLLFSFPGNGKSIFLGNPYGNITQDTTNKIFYGMANTGGKYNYGGIFSYNPITNQDSVILSFNDSNGAYPSGSLIQASNGLLYGMTGRGGKNGDGVLFSFNPFTGKDSVVINFNGSNGSNLVFWLGSFCTLIQASNGLLYGMTPSGGVYNDGVLFSFNTSSNKDSVLLNFNGTNGNSSYGSLMQASNGLLYGMSFYGGTTSSSDGVLFSFDPSTGKDSVLIKFDSANGKNPLGSLMQASNGLLYGMTGWGGTKNKGVLFSFNTLNGRDSVLLNFDSLNGGWPYGSLFQASNGLLYGMTAGGGTYNNGVIFIFNTLTNKDSVIVNLQGMKDGATPYCNVIQASDGLLYGMTVQGGSSGNGVLFKLDPVTFQDTTLLNFGGGGGVWYGLNQNSLIQASNGSFYGMTYYGGTYNDGTLFSYSPITGKDTVLLNFNGVNGELPLGALVQASNSLLYGMTTYGGTNNDGVLFSYNLITNKDSVLMNFNNSTGINPFCSLIQASNGILYGLTSEGGKYKYTGGPYDQFGTLFSFNPITGKDSVLYNFNDTNGGDPLCNLIQASDGLLYGVTRYGGSYGSGVIFSFDPNTGRMDSLFNLPYGGLSQGNVLVDTTLHVIYGTSDWGGTYNDGVLFGFNVKTQLESTLINFSGANGMYPTGTLLWDTAANLIYSTTYGGGNSNYGVLYSYNTVTGKDSVLLNFYDSIGANPCGIILVNSNPLAVNNVQQKKDLVIVYPNPFHDIATILFGEEGKHFIELDDLQGNKLRWLSTNSKQYNIARNGLAAGMYLVKFYDSNQHYLSTTKIVVQ